MNEIHRKFYNVTTCYEYIEAYEKNYYNMHEKTTLIHNFLFCNFINFIKFFPILHSILNLFTQVAMAVTNTL